MQSIVSTCLGFPRIGARRELKRALEAYWAKKATGAELERTAAELRERHWRAMQAAGLSQLPSNDFSFYDSVLDMAVTVGAIPTRYRQVADPLARYFAMARGLQDREAGVDLPALEMTKWFDTNYHYIVPEIDERPTFALDPTKLLGELTEARALGIETRPVILGPVSFLLLSKSAPGAASKAHPLDALASLLDVYVELLGQLKERGVAWIQLDEPCLVLDLEPRARKAYTEALPRLLGSEARPRLLLSTYFGALRDNLPLVSGLALDALHVDLVRAPEQLDAVLEHLHPKTLLSLGLVDGRNIWRTDLDAARTLLRQAARALGSERIQVASSCSLLHVPVDLSLERHLDPEVTSWLAFAQQKLGEIVALAQAADWNGPLPALFEETRATLANRRASTRTHDPAVRSRAGAVTRDMLRRSDTFPHRRAKQHQRFGLPVLPTTTIGSFPQTNDVRAARARFRSGQLSWHDYNEFLRRETRDCVERQERLGLDVLVHGELERTDMVEYFGEKLAGFAFTDNGWVQSYGSRCVKPPVLFGDVSRPEPMTVDWSRYAQSLTKRPMKGMLTGPVTILQWSFVRDDQPREQTCLQIALALRDEVLDLESAGIPMIQVDEPALREGLPLRRADHVHYLHHAIDAFRLATSGVRDETQIHTHMCYSEFGDIFEAIAALDADVLSIETSRSKLELFADFRRLGYSNEVGPGVYDIHSPRVPSVEELVALLETAASVLPAKRLWVNPDCGLKTRGWAEVEAALANMVQAAAIVRSKLPNQGR